jgi:hypothetical protein
MQRVNCRGWISTTTDLPAIVTTVGGQLTDLHSALAKLRARRQILQMHWFPSKGAIPVLVLFTVGHIAIHFCCERGRRFSEDDRPRLPATLPTEPCCRSCW